MANYVFPDDLDANQSEQKLNHQKTLYFEHNILCFVNDYYL